ncbi:hypothetical protein D9757_013868 [Collybiopsis confluens]|uniref:Uncharacterized protein n=1 Tax=Collybiopsis confluens TaxID=2823264 RepID=A0A8H5FQ91_9AGAR|nr:hypothetical protein D9757_013868 [Collybiopsis confluens]
MTASTQYSRYKIQSSDVLQDARTNVIDETSEKVVWYKERFLGDDEIIEHLVHSPTQSIHWTIHRPARKGWYIRIRSPSFPPGVFIPLLPVQKRGRDEKGGIWDDGAVIDGSLGFRTRVIDGKPSAGSSSSSTMTRMSTTALVHSYPPTPPPPPTLSLTPASPPPSLSSYSLDEPISTLASSSSMTLLGHSTDTLLLPPSSSSSSSPTIAEFLLSPTTASTNPSTEGLLSRALKAFKYYTASTDIISNGYSFTLSRVIIQAPPPPLHVALAAAAPGSGSILPTTMSPSLSGTGTGPPPPASGTPSSSLSSTPTPPSVSASESASPSPPLRKLRSPIPLLTFTDLTPAFNISGSLSGSLVVDKREAEVLGIEQSFWVAVGLVYVGFLEERGSYLASLGD